MKTATIIILQEARDFHTNKNQFAAHGLNWRRLDVHHQPSFHLPSLLYNKLKHQYIYTHNHNHHSILYKAFSTRWCVVFICNFTIRKNILWNLCSIYFLRLKIIRCKWPLLRVSSSHVDMDHLQKFQVTLSRHTSFDRHNSATIKMC